MKVILACDESGAKGYADQRESYPGEVGVFAGILVPEEMLSPTEIALEAAVAPFRGQSGKLHVAELPAPEKPIVRMRVHDALRQLRLPCFWYAIHVDGYHGHFRAMNESIERIFNSTGDPSLTAPRDKKHSLHADFFRGLYSHIVCFIEERAPGDVEIEVRTDRVDRPIARSFRREAERLLDYGPRTTAIKGYDRKRKAPTRGELRSYTDWPDELRLATNVASLTITPVSDTDPIVVAADVLANGLLHHFRSRDEATLYSDLNRPGALAGHPLAASFDTFRNWGGPDICDRLFRHPRAPAPGTDAALRSGLAPLD